MEKSWKISGENGKIIGKYKEMLRKDEEMLENDKYKYVKTVLKKNEKNMEWLCKNKGKYGKG